MTRQVQNPLTCASPSDEVSEVAASSQRRDTVLQRTASSLNLYKIIGDSSSEIVWEQASAPNADCIFSGDPRFACANKCLTVEEAYETVHPDDQPLLRSDIDSLHSGEQDSFSRRIRALGCDGSWIPVDVCARSLRDNNRTPLYLIGGFKGISNLPPLSRHPAIPSYPTLSGNVSFPGAASPFPTVWNGSSAIRATTSGAWRTLSACFTPVILPSSTNA